MNSFPKEYFIFLSDEELKHLATASNRDDYRPDLDFFLTTTKKLSVLRMLSFEKQDHNWNPPVLSESDGTIVDDRGNLRGYKQVFCLPVRPGEPQMALSYDWFWSEFCDRANKQGVYAFLTDTELCIYQPSTMPQFQLEEFWKQLWDIFASKEYLRKSVLLYLNNKTLFKNPASPWTAKTIPILSKEQALFLIDYYQHGSKRNKLFKQSTMSRAIQELQTTVNNNSFDVIPFPSQSKFGVKRGGDFHKGEETIPCAGCGELIAKNKGFKRTALFLKDADERPQSASNKDDLNIFCPRCIATVFFCPIKLTPESLAVKFYNRNTKHDSWVCHQGLKQELRKYVAQSLHVAAGDYIGLHIEERLNGKPLLQTMGAYYYALWKMAVTFSPELFAQGFSVEVYPGEETFRLPCWLLWIASALATWNDVFQYKCYREDKFRSSFNAYLHLLSKKKIFQAFYVLISGKDKMVHESYVHTWKMYQLQDILEKFEKILQKEDPMPIPDYPKIIGFAGLLLPLAQRVESAQKRDKERAIKKLLEEVDRPIQYAYTAARDSGSKEFIFCKRASNKFFFDKALELLAWAGEDVEKLKTDADRIVNEKEEFSWARDAEEKIFISTDQIARVTSALVVEGEKPYANEADWRSFAYQVKLALWSFFPQYLGSRE